jgi:hypothetical protein
MRVGGDGIARDCYHPPMRASVDRFGVALPGTLLLLLSVGCAIKKPVEKHYYEQHIQPILNNFCVGNTSPCHRIDPVTRGALGNLDLSSFESVRKRPDVLRKYGSYPLPLLLLKAVPESLVQIPYRDPLTHQYRLLGSEIRHAGGKSISNNSDAFYVLDGWLRNGANRDGVAPQPQPNQGIGACSTTVPPDRDLAAVNVGSDSYQRFVADVAPKLKESCAFASCHSAEQSDFYITCGDDDQQLRFNFLQATGFVTTAPLPFPPPPFIPPVPEQSEILLRPLAPEAGGVSHTGGTFFQSRSDATWLSWRDWAVAVQMDPPPEPAKSQGQKFFEAEVMPRMIQRGCALEGCHSPNGFNDFRLRPGAQGFFAPQALRRNYEATVNEFMAIDTVDVRQSRAVKKNIFPGSGGIAHRAGAVLEGEASTETCPAVFDAAAASPFCTFAELHRLERADRGARVSPMAPGEVIPLAFVARPADPDSLLEFDTFRGGADLMVADAILGPRGAVTSVTNARSVLGACAGLAAGTSDVRGPEWSADGRKLVFAARPSAASGLDLWVIDMAGGAGSCRQLTSDNGRMQGPVKVHNFDPVFAPDPDGSIVFASTRAGTLTLKRFLPNADLFRTGPGADFNRVEQMTFLLGSEIGPAFMLDGRVSFTAEKASPEFYQLSGRRINWDLTDYHPLLAQRAESTDTFSDALQPSIGYSQATEIREGLDRNFLVILSNVDAHGGGGALATFNRSVGPFQADRVEQSFLKSVQIVDPAATGRAGTAGVYRSPSSLPNGEILASYASNIQDPASGMPKYELVGVEIVAMDPTTGAPGARRRTLLTDPNRSYVEAVLGYKRAESLLFRNLPQLVFGGHVDGADSAVMHFPDVPLLATLLGANLRRGRNFAPFDAAVALKVYEERPPATANPPDLQGSQKVYVERISLGSASFESDHSLKVQIGAVKKPLILELVDNAGKPVFTMSEEHQVAAGEYITPGISRTLFNGVCGGCHGSLSGDELDVAVTPDALTGASVSRSRDLAPKALQ